MRKKSEVSDTPSELDNFKSQLTGSSPEAIENEMIALAIKETEWRIRNHKASSQELVHYLKLGSETARLERENLKAELELKRAKASAIEEARNSAELYENAINAMKLYSGVEDL